MMKSKLLFLALLLCLSAPALSGPGKGSPFGLGLAVPMNFGWGGAGLALSGKYWFNGTNAVDMTLDGGNGWIGVSADYLWHKYGVFGRSRNVRIPLYFGAGGYVTSWNAGPFNGTALGVQGKFGVTWLFRAPFDVFVEAVPALNLAPATGFGVGLGAGGRFYF